jgi:hypothetical protein
MSAVNAIELCITRFHDVLGDVMAHGHTPNAPGTLFVSYATAWH